MGFFFLCKRAKDFVKGASVILFGKIVKGQNLAIKLIVIVCYNFTRAVIVCYNLNIFLLKINFDKSTILGCIFFLYTLYLQNF